MVVILICMCIRNHIFLSTHYYRNGNGQSDVRQVTISKIHHQFNYKIANIQYM